MVQTVKESQIRDDQCLKEQIQQALQEMNQRIVKLENML
jgi:hypothetical protein